MHLSLKELGGQLAVLGQSISHLHWATVEGRPEKTPDFPFMRLQDEMLSWQGLLAEANDAVEIASNATQPEFNLQETQRSLATCHDLVIQISSRFYDGLVASDMYGELFELAYRQPEQGWIPWTHGVRDALNQCPHAIINVERALLTCWQELTDKAHVTTVSAQAAAIGPNIYIGKEA